MAQSPRRITTSTLAMVCVVAVFAACSDRTGPATARVGQLGIAPRYRSSAAALVDVAAIRIVLVSTFDERVALDTVIAFPPGQDSVSLGFAVALEQVGEEFSLFLRLIGPAGDTVFTSGPDVVRPATGGATPTLVEPVLTYVGVGANAAAVVVTSPDTTLFFGGAVVLQAVALDPAQAPIPGTPIEWISLDPLVVVVPDADSGRVIAGTQRGTARIVARLLTGQADTVRVVAQPVPSAIVAETGGGQIAPGGGVLPLPLVARVTAADGLGVRGVWVRFAVTVGGGSLGADSLRTDSTGRTSVAFQLGQTGPQTVQATTAGLPGQFPSFSATVQAGPPAGIAIVAGDGQSAIAGSSVAVAPRVVVTDSAGRLVSGAPVSFGVTAGGGSVAGATPVTGANGEAAVSGWTLGAVAGPNALRAIVVAPPTDTFSVTFAATGIPGPASLLQLVSGDAQSDTAGATLTQPLVVRATDANGNGRGGVPIAWTVTAGSVSADTVVTDAAGLAPVTWTLPTTVGSPNAAARIAGTAVTRGFTAAVRPAVAQRVAFTVQPTTAVQGAVIAPPVAIEITDRFGNRRAADTGTAVSVAIGANPSGGTLGGTRTRPVAGGIASFADLTIDAFGTGYTLVATAAGLVPDTSAAFDVLAPSGQVAWTNAAGGTWSAGANWSSGTPPGPTDTAFITLGGTFVVTLDVNATLAGLVLGGASGTQTVTGTARTLTLNGPGTVGPNGVLSLSGGGVTGTGALANQGQATLLNVPVGVAVANAGVLRLQGTTALNGAVSNAVGAELRVEASSVNAQVTTAAGWTNAGTLLLTHGGGGGGQSGTLTVNGVLVNAVGAVLRSEAGVGGGPRTLDATLDNRGLVDIQTALTLSRPSAAHVNSGVIDLAGANLTVTQSGATPSLTSIGTITVGAGRTLAVTGGTFTNSGAGVIHGAGTVDVATTTFANAGLVGPGLSAGVLTVTGNYPQTASGTLAIELGGTTVGSQYDRLVVTGAATLAGTLNVTLIGGFTPAAGDQVTVLTFASRTGDFATVNLPALAGGLTWQRSFTGTAMVLVVTNPFAGAPPGTDAAWTGASSTSWTDPGNWAPGVPGPTDDVFIRADATNPLVVAGVRTIDSLTVQAGASLTVGTTADTLVVGGSLDAGYPAIGGSGAVRLTGTSQSARGRVPNLAVTGTISAADSLIVPGTLAVTGSGDLNVGPRRVRVGGNLSTAGTATITMQNAAGRLDVAGSATFGGGSTTGRLTDGTFHLAGSLTQSGNAESFAPSGAHLTVLDGGGGTLTFANPAQAGGSHFHHLSVLMSGTASNGGALVINGNLSIQDTAQFAPSGIVGGSGNRITVVGSAIVAQSSTAAVLTSDVLRFGGTLSRNAGAVVDGDTVEFFGTGQAVPTNLSSAFALKVTGDSVLFTGSTAWRGMLVTGNGLADIGGATVAVDSTFRTTGNGRIRMTNPAGTLSVRREARFEGGSTAGRMTAGTLDLGGHFSQAGFTSPSSFAPSGTHLTQFRNFDYVPGNPSVVPVTIAMSNTFASFFRNLLIDQEISATLPFHTVVTGALTKPEFATLTGTALEVHGDLTAGGALNGIIDLDTAYVGGVLTPNLSSQDYRITVLVMIGASQTLPSFPHYASVVVEGDSVVIAGGVSMGSLLIHGTGLADVGGAVQVNGSIETRDQGRLRMAGGSLFAGGGATFGGGSTAGLLTGGTLTLAGGLTQTAVNSPSSFAASAGHVTEFATFDFRAIDFASPDSLASHFGTLSVGGAGELRLVSSVHAVGQLRTPAVAGGVVRTLSGLNLQGTRLVTRGVDVDSLDFKALHLVVADGASIGRFRDVRFVEQDPGVDRLVVRRAGGSYTFERVTFTTAPDPGFAYVSVFDADGTAATPFNLTMDQPSPADPGPFTKTDGIATLTWAAGALLSGTVRNAVGGVEISGATVDLKQGPNAPQSDPTLLSTVTDAAGRYSFTGLATGDYTLWVAAAGFIDGSVAAITVGSGVNTVDVALSPLQQAGETRIVVSWGATPTDLDSWLVVPDTVGGPPNYVSYASPGAAAAYPFSQLDNDVTSGYGPETITIYQQLAGTYQFRVHDYGAGDDAASTTLLASEARVDVYQNNELVQTFTVPNAPGTLWTVFELDGGTITPINTMSGDSPSSPVAGAATQLAFSVQPTNAGAGATITPPVQVTALDAFGAVATNFTGVVTVSLANGTGLTGTLSVAAVGSVATFGDLRIDQAASGYYLEAVVGSGGVQAAFSQFFDVAAPAQLGGTVRAAARR